MLGVKRGVRLALWSSVAVSGTRVRAGWTWRRHFCVQGSSSIFNTVTVDHFGSITVHLDQQHFPQQLDQCTFQKLLHDSLEHWKAEGRVAVWIHVPILQSRFIAAAAAEGFTFHHTEKDCSTLSLWLAQGQSRLPPHATHQVGVAGAVLNEANGKVLVVQDKNKTTKAWKFPGGLSNPGEDIGETAVREVFEETGVKTEFKSLLSIRQQHNHPGAFGKSDMYMICRLTPVTFDIDFCRDECLRCEWLDLEELIRSRSTTLITNRVARLLFYGYREGFEKIDLTVREFPAVYTRLLYKLYHKELPEKYEGLKQEPFK